MSDKEYIIKGEERRKKLDKRRNIMRVNGRGLKSIILPLLGRKSKMDFNPAPVTKKKK